MFQTGDGWDLKQTAPQGRGDLNRRFLQQKQNPHLLPRRSCLLKELQEQCISAMDVKISNQLNWENGELFKQMSYFYERRSPPYIGVSEFELALSLIVTLALSRGLLQYVWFSYFVCRLDGKEWP